MSYALLKSIHLFCVVATFVLFWIRGWWMWSESPRRRARWVRLVPHVIDALLLASAAWRDGVVYEVILELRPR